MKELPKQSFRDMSRGTIRTVQSSLVPRNSYMLGLNLDSDNELGALISRLGNTIIGVECSATYPCLGAHQHVGTSTVFAAFSDGTNNNIYDVSDGSKVLEDDTKDSKTRFLSYLGATVRVNGVDANKYYNGTSWISDPTGAAFTAATNDFITDVAHGLLNGDVVSFTTTDTLPAGLSLLTNYYVVEKTDDTFKVSLTKGGTAVDITDTGTGTHTWAYWDPFDILDMPICEGLIEWKDRIYIYGADVGSGILQYSSIADPDTRSISWNETGSAGTGQIEIEQEDGGGDIEALNKVPGYLLIFKTRTLKRWNGSSTFPEDMINLGAPSQEATCYGRGMCFSFNYKGIFITNGGYPTRISKPIDDFIKAIPTANLSSVNSFCDEEHAYFYIGDVTINNDEYTNIVLKYNIDSQSWDIYSYYNELKMMIKYVDSDGKEWIAAGDGDGQALKLNSGNTDYISTTAVFPIHWTYESQDIEFEGMGEIKDIDRAKIFTRNVRNDCNFMARANSNDPKNWDPKGVINDDIVDLKGLSMSGNYFNFKINGFTDSGQVKLLGFEFPRQSTKIKDNTHE